MLVADQNAAGDQRRREQPVADLDPRPRSPVHPLELSGIEARSEPEMQSCCCRYDNGRDEGDEEGTSLPSPDLTARVPGWGDHGRIDQRGDRFVKFPPETAFDGVGPWPQPCPRPWAEPSPNPCATPSAKPAAAP